MGNSWGTYTPKYCLFSQNFGITTLRQQITENTVIAVFMRLQGIFYARFYFKTLAYESIYHVFLQNHINFFTIISYYYNTMNIQIVSYLYHHPCHHITLTPCYPPTNVIFNRKTNHANSTFFRSAYANFPVLSLINHRYCYI